MKTKKNTEDNRVFVRCPIDENTDVDGVYILDNEEVVWHYYYSNGERGCYGYTIRKRQNKKYE